MNNLLIDSQPCSLPHPSNKRSMLALTVAMLLCNVNAFAFAFETKNQTNQAVVIYGDSYFKDFSVLTADEMIRLIPGTNGVMSDVSGGGRGFGAGGQQILIDGKRVSGKSNGVMQTLSRIPTAQVAHIELIRGGVSGLEVQSKGLLVNVVLRQDRSNSSTMWRVDSGYDSAAGFSHNVKISHNGKSNTLSYMVEAQVKRDNNARAWSDDYQSTQGKRLETRQSNSDDRSDSASITTNLSYERDNGHSWRLNALYRLGDRQRSRYTGQNVYLNGQVTRSSFTRPSQHENYDWEFGGDYALTLSRDAKVKVMFIGNEKHQDDVRHSDTSDSTKSVIRQEKILRTSWANQLLQRHDIEFAAEVALNSYSSDFNLSYQSDGVLEYFDEQFSIDEKRAELFASHSYTFDNAMVLQSSLTAESSEIGNAGAKRNYSFLKPRINLTIDLSPREQLRLTSERKVSQLGFHRFTSGFDIENGEVRKGNLNLTPQHSWDYSIVYDKRLMDDAGTVEFEVRYQDINDHSRKMDSTIYQTVDSETGETSDITVDDLSYLSSPTNDGKAHVLDLIVRSSLRLDRLGLQGAVLSGDYRWRDSDMLDPFTAKHRQLDWNAKNQWGVKFRHNISDSSISYGMDYSYSGVKGYTNIRDTFEKEGEYSNSAFIAMNIFGDIKITLRVDSIVESRPKSIYTRYNSHIRDNDVEYFRVGMRERNAYFSLSLQGRI